MKPKYLLVATTNQGKFKEIFEVLGALDVSKGGNFRVISLADLCEKEGLFDMSDFDGLIEDGENFEENAKKKAKFYHEKTGLLTVAEDSGILVSALKGELGVKTRRWGAGENASDEEWIDFFMERMSSEEDRGAKFVCSACVCDGGVCEVFEGETCGEITREICAPILGGLPLSSCFLAEGCEKVYADLGPIEKNKVSHRGKAMGRVKEFLEINLL